MTIEADIVTRLNAYGGLTALISSRVYPVIFPQNPTVPAVAYSRVSNNVEVTLENLEAENPRFQFDVIGSTYSSVRAVVVQLKEAMRTATTYQSILISDNDFGYDDNAELYRAVIDFSIWQQ